MGNTQAHRGCKGSAHCIHCKRDLTLKRRINIYGDPAVGKSMMVNRHVKNAEFDAKYSPTNACDFATMRYSFKNGETSVTWWENAGETFDGRRSFSSFDGLILMYDVSNIDSFSNLEKWVVGVDRELPKLVLGNKTDSKDKRAVTTKQGEDYAQSIGATFKEISVKDMTQKAIDKLLSDFAQQTIEQLHAGEYRSRADYLAKLDY